MMTKYRLIKIRHKNLTLQQGKSLYGVYGRELTIKEVMGVFNSIEEAEKYIYNESYDDSLCEIEYVIEEVEDE